ncbi:hypothetical protein [Catellatospora sp. NPDC049609]|uniref:Rv0361 family membrane protein n=1 Tax=Catellatospora sp. NPDC049609 TaxID=3155505 RepID=UPI0034465E5D
MTQPTDDQQPTEPQSSGQGAYPPPADPFASAAVTPPTAPQPPVPLPPTTPATPTPPVPAAPATPPPAAAEPTPAQPTPVPPTPAQPVPPTPVPPTSAPPAPVPPAQTPVSGAPAPVSGTPAPGFTTPTAAYPTSGQPAYPAPGQPAYPTSGQPAYPTSGQPAYPTSGQPAYPGQPAYAAPGQPGYPGAPYPGMPGVPAAPAKKSKAPLVIGIVLGVLLLLCGGGITAWVLLNRNTEGVGAATAKDAATTFLTKVYKDGDAAGAEKVVCGDARDRKEIEAKIAEIKAEKDKLKGPNFTWETPKISGETATEATAEVTVKLVTSDEKMSEQKLTLILVKHEGWFVCEVK